jgi:hypothetical protein
MWYGARDHPVDLEALQDVAVRISGERSVDAVLHTIVLGLAQQPHVALARVWVTGPGDVCESCRMRDRCPDRTSCLHLSASAGTALGGEDWSRIDGAFRRVPFGNAVELPVSADFMSGYTARHALGDFLGILAVMSAM